MIRPDENDLSPPLRRWWLAAILLLAAVLRLAWLGSVPDGLHPDEASNAWNAKCILTAYMDEHGQTLPILYTRTFNDNRTTSYLYLVALFEAFGGMNAWTLRLPAALAGIGAVGMLYLALRPLAGTRVALAAAGLLAIDPTHVQHTRWGIEAPLTPLLVLTCVWLWQKSGLLLTRGRTPSLKWAIIAGAATAISCYAYAAIRIYLPLLAMTATILTFLPFRGRLSGGRTDAHSLDRTDPQALSRPLPMGEEKRRRVAWAGGLLAFAILFAPLLYAHLTDPAINARGRATLVWSADDSPAMVFWKVAGRYVEHFSPAFLFVTGSTDPSLAPPRPLGALSWGALQLIVIGAVACLRQRRSAFAMFLLAALLLYPAGDVLNAAGNANVVRSFPGWWIWSAIGAVGLVAIFRLSRPFGIATTIFAAIATSPHFALLATRHNADPSLETIRGVDLRDACRFVKPLIKKYDAVVFTTTDAQFNYAQALVYLNYDAEDFLDGPLARGLAHNPDGPEPDLLARVDNLFFLQKLDEVPGMIDEAIRLGWHRKSLWVLRPEELTEGDRILHTSTLSNGTAGLMVVERVKQR